MRNDLFIFARLNSQADWDKLESLIAPDNYKCALRSIFASAKELNTISAIVEREYIDQDFSSDFAAFYSKVFRRYRKICMRVHFFSESVELFTKNSSAEGLATVLQEVEDRGGYVGFMVIRPLKHARFGRVVLKAPPSPHQMQADLLVRAVYRVHLLGAELRVEGSPYTQQDTRIGACAQAAIWSAARHFYTKHDGAWVSMAEVAEAASKPADRVLSLSLPAGSKFLSQDNMIRALKEIGREPLLFSGQFDQATSKIRWPAPLQPSRIISQYVDSGIPVILGLVFPRRQIGHAVLAVGQTTTTLSSPVALSKQPSRAEFLHSFLVNDDQLGVQLRMPLKPGTPFSQTAYDVESNLLYLIVPLPKKVYMPAEVAEAMAWNLIEKYHNEWEGFKKNNKHKPSFDDKIGDEFSNEIVSGSVVSRTYLTWGWKYRQRIMNNKVPDAVKSAIIDHALPKFVWVTEFGTFDSFNKTKIDDCEIYAHMVADATSSDYPEARLIFHAPGLLHRWYHDPTDDHKEYVQARAVVLDDRKYRPKVRGII